MTDPSKPTLTRREFASTAALAALTEWAHGNGRMSDAEYAGYKAIYGAGTGN